MQPTKSDGDFHKALCCLEQHRFADLWARRGASGDAHICITKRGSGDRG